MGGQRQLLLYNIKCYWRSIMLFLYPCMLIPIIYKYPDMDGKCMYMLALMGGFYAMHLLPIIMTSLLPMVLFKPLGLILSTEELYPGEAIVLLILSMVYNSLIIESNLHIRAALHLIVLNKGSIRKLHFSVLMTSAFLSLWNFDCTIAIIMCPLVETIIIVLECEGIGTYYVKKDSHEPQIDENDILEIQELSRAFEENIRKKQMEIRYQRHSFIGEPAPLTVAFYLAVAYGCALGHLSSHLTLIGHYEALRRIYFLLTSDPFPITFIQWFLIYIPMVVLIGLVISLWLQFRFMGLFKPDAYRVSEYTLGEDCVSDLRKKAKQELANLGNMSHNEIIIITSLCSIILCYILSATFAYVKDSLTYGLAIFFIFVSLADGEKKDGLVVKLVHSWSYYSGHILWSVVYYYSSTTAVRNSIESSNLIARMVDVFASIVTLPPSLFSVISGCICLILAQFFLFQSVGSSLAKAAAVAVVRKGHITVLEALLSISLYCGFTFCLPTSSGSNYVVSNYCNMKRIDMLKAGLGCCLISLCISSVAFLTITHIILRGSL